MSSIHQILKQYWGYEIFRPMQEEIITSVLTGTDTLALLPTGGGKSLCFQVPGILKDGLCLVVSPLVALMKDQVESLRKKGITAFYIYSGMSRKEVIKTLTVSANSNCKFLYVSPERLETKLFLEYLPALNISLLAIDEAHCISQWGYDFRPPYLRIAALREQLPGVPVLALTASATKAVEEDICTRLLFTRKAIFRQSFERPYLSYSVFHSDAKILKLVEIHRKVAGSSIVYCKSRKRTKEIAEQLRSYGIEADHFHAGLTSEEKDNKQENWINNKMRTIVCTSAFGMGIDKPDVRTVIHFDSPDSLESYYQEAGRAGRDNKKAYAVLLYHQKDISYLEDQVKLRFPSLEEIRQVYQAIVNYLQIPEGMGEGNYYEFILSDFIEKFKLPSHVILNSLKVLEQEDRICFNEQIFIPSKLVFTCNKDLLYDFELSHPNLEPIIKALLRSYEGIFDQEVSINEKSLAYLTGLDLNKVGDSLQQLSRFNIISYKPQRDQPQLFFVTNRIKAEQLRIDTVQYNQRKEQYAKRVAAMSGYIHTSGCRSRVIGNYFGDDKIRTCGICDNCLREKQNRLHKDEFLLIEKQIMTALKHKPIHSSDISQLISGVKKDKAWKVIEFLQAEKKIEVNKEGVISIRS